MLILGIDPGYGRMGYAVLSKTKNHEKLLGSGCIQTSSKKEQEIRIMEIAESVEKIINKFKPETLAIEKLFFTKNQKTALAVAEIRGIVIYLALKEKMKVVQFTPLEVKSAVCGYGKAPKEQVGKMVKLILKTTEKIEYDDTADAIALCLACASNPQQNF